MTANPLLQHWATPFELPPFGDIRPEHFMPAFEEALAQHNAEIHAIAESDASPDFANTIEALEKSGDALSKVSGVFYNLSSADTNEALQAVERSISPRMAAHYSAIYMRSDLFARVAALHDARATLGLDAEQMRVLERYFKAFVRSGAKLGADDKVRMAEIVQRLATLGTQFSQNVLKDESAWEMVLTEDDLAGLPDPVRAAAAQGGKDRGHDGQFVITLSRSSVEPFLQFSARRDLREKAFKAWTMRGQNGGATDNIAIVQEMLQLRAERAQLLGYRNFAQFKLDDTMAKTPEAVRDLLETVWRKGAAQAERERADLEAFARSAGDALTI
ncbi:MAG: M3 family metallopeptidase, partial [Beijerinckiaceae bacterium]